LPLRWVASALPACSACAHSRQTSSQVRPLLPFC
jgi:hypothetical protein